jgi:predicted metalloenzyme YecM
MDLTLLKTEAQGFLEKLERALIAAGIDLASHWDLDHLCYRTQTDEEYTILKNEFLGFGKLLIESEVNGRLISTFKLNEFIVFKDWHIDLIELPAPKKAKITPRGFEHIEIVCDLTFEELIKQFSENPSGLSKLYNRELEISIDDINLKFHHCSLESVVTLESNTRVWKAICASRVLEIFRDFDPLVAGTFPLGIANPKSDVDVILDLSQSDQIEAFILICRNHFSSYHEFHLKQHDEIDDFPTVVLNFSFEGIPFEVFAQARPSIRQKAYLHYLVEERLLKFGGEPFKNQVIAARNRGLKTEPAFAEVLGLEGDPYVSLLKVGFNSDLVLQIKDSMNRRSKPSP